MDCAGGSVSLPNKQLTFTVQPAKTRRKEPPTYGGGHTCNLNDWVFYKEFNIQGYGFAEDDWGQSKLLGNLRGCGVVTDWEFTYYDSAQCNSDKGQTEPPEWDCWEWYSTGKLPIGPQIKGCVYQALKDAGSRGSKRGSTDWDSVGGPC